MSMPTRVQPALYGPLVAPVSDRIGVPSMVTLNVAVADGALAHHTKNSSFFGPTGIARVCVSVPVSALVVPPNQANHWPLCATSLPQVAVHSGVPKLLDVCVQGVAASPSSKLPSCTMKLDVASVSVALAG